MYTISSLGQTPQGELLLWGLLLAQTSLFFNLSGMLKCWLYQFLSYDYGPEATMWVKSPVHGLHRHTELESGVEPTTLQS